MEKGKGSLSKYFNAKALAAGAGTIVVAGLGLTFAAHAAVPIIAVGAGTLVYRKVWKNDQTAPKKFPLNKPKKGPGPKK